MKSFFIDEKPTAEYKLQKLKNMIENRVKRKEQLVHYNCRYDCKDPVTEWPRLKDLEIEFVPAVCFYFILLCWSLTLI